MGSPSLVDEQVEPFDRAAKMSQMQPPLLAAVTAAALALPITGTAPGGKGVAVRDPATLRPLTGAPRLPRNTTQVELSPDATQLAVASETPTGQHYRSHLSFYDRSSRRRTGRMRIVLQHRVLSWLTPNRLALVKRGKPATVRIVNPRRRKVIRRVKLRARLSDTAKIGQRLAVLTAVKTGGEQRLAVFSADGRRERAVDLPGMVSGSLHGRTPTGDALVLSGQKSFAYAVDVATGEVTKHDLDLPEGGYEWLEPPSGSMLAVGTFGTVAILDPTSFDVVKTVKPGGDIEGAGDGFVSFSTEGDAPVAVYDGQGEMVWSKPLVVLDVIAFGDRLYTGSGYDDVNLRVFDLASGDKLATIPGRASLFEPALGRVRVPFFDSHSED